jgi:hypothetical protein
MNALVLIGPMLVELELSHGCIAMNIVTCVDDPKRMWRTCPCDFQRFGLIFNMRSSQQGRLFMFWTNWGSTSIANLNM